MMLARKFLRRAPVERRLLVRAVLLHAWLATLIRAVRFGRVSQWATSG